MKRNWRSFNIWVVIQEESSLQWLEPLISHNWSWREQFHLLFRMATKHQNDNCISPSKLWTLLAHHLKANCIIGWKEETKSTGRNWSRMMWCCKTVGGFNYSVHSPWMVLCFFLNKGIWHLNGPGNCQFSHRYKPKRIIKNSRLIAHYFMD